MSKRILSCLRPCAILAIAAFVDAGGLHAASLTWDASGTTPAAPTGGAGTWSSSAANWSTGAADIGWNNANGDNAIFANAASASIVTLGEAITVNNLNINSVNYTIAGSFFLTVTGTITNTQTTTITARVTGADLNKAGAGNLVLNNSGGANTYTGNTNILAGVLQTRSANALAATTNVAISSGGTLDVRASQTVAGISGLGTVTQSQSASTVLTINPDGATVAADSTFTGVIRNGDATHILGLTKAGSHTLTLGGDNTYTGNTTISGGVLQLGSANRIADASNLVLSGGTFATGGFSETLGTLALSATSSIDLGNGASALVFADSSAATWGGSFTLNILNYDASTDSIRFGSSASGLTSAQLAQIRINNGAALIDANGFLSTSAVPEPSTYAIFAGAAGLAAAVYLRRRRA